MRILHVHENLIGAGGIETYLLSLNPLLEETGHETAFVFAQGDSGLARTAFQVAALADPSSSARRRGAAELSQIVRSWRPDVVHMHNLYNVGAVDACLSAAPTILTAHDFRHVCPASSFYYKRTEEICSRTCGAGCFAVTARKHCMSLRPRVAWRYYRRVKWMAENWGRFAHLVAPSHAARERFQAAGFPEERTSVVPYFCPVTPLDTPRPVPERPTVLFLGRISELKGYRYFIEALGRLPSDVHGVMVGNFTSSKRARVESLSASCGCEGRLELRNWAGRDEIASIVQSASVLCFPSLWPETLGIVGLEALACGVPVAASDVGGVREWLLPNETGVLVKPKDSAALASAVSNMIQDPAGLREMGERGIQLIRSHFSPEVHLSKLLAIYEAAADGVRSQPNLHQPCTA